MKIHTTTFNEILTLIHNSKQKAFHSVNGILIELYWNIGHHLSEKTVKEKWGKSVVEELANFIQHKEPNIRGFTARNLWRMKQFYETYKENKKLSTLLTELSWSNNLLILSSTKSEKEREFYLQLCIQEKYSHRELQRQISSGVYERTELANIKLSPVVKDFPKNTQNIFRDSYSLEFLGLPMMHSENDLQKALVGKLKDFILEIGRDFCFMGQEYRLQVGNSDFEIDLLFYHRALQCMVVFELKIDNFKPAYLGQLEFYLEVLDKEVKKEYENPSIGVLLCRKKDDEVVKYALNRSLSPTVIAEYETKLIPKDVLQKKLNELYEAYEDEIKIMDDAK
ncbi:MAG: PDDEXK nuclease domain-containing protein [Sulfurimonas sp.]|jgi:predicted nuclease of restriction endonuclease-like (RecB) superfamily